MRVTWESYPESAYITLKVDNDTFFISWLWGLREYVKTLTIHALSPLLSGSMRKIKQILMRRKKCPKLSFYDVISLVHGQFLPFYVRCWRCTGQQAHGIPLSSAGPVSRPVLLVTPIRRRELLVVTLMGIKIYHILCPGFSLVCMSSFI